LLPSSPQFAYCILLHICCVYPSFGCQLHAQPQEATRKLESPSVPAINTPLLRSLYFESVQTLSSTTALAQHQHRRRCRIPPGAASSRTFGTSGDQGLSHIPPIEGHFYATYSAQHARRIHVARVNLRQRSALSGTSFVNVHTPELPRHPLANTRRRQDDQFTRPVPCTLTRSCPNAVQRDPTTDHV
jgi:hypothetical protein